MREQRSRDVPMERLGDGGVNTKLYLTYCLLPIAYCLLPIAYCLLPHE